MKNARYLTALLDQSVEVFIYDQYMMEGNVQMCTVVDMMEDDGDTVEVKRERLSFACYRDSELTPVGPCHDFDTATVQHFVAPEDFVKYDHEMVSFGNSMAERYTGTKGMKSEPIDEGDVFYFYDIYQAMILDEQKAEPIRAAIMEDCAVRALNLRQLKEPHSRTTRFRQIGISLKSCHNRRAELLNKLDEEQFNQFMKATNR